MLDYLAFIIQAENVDACPVVVVRPLLAAMQDYIIAFSEDALKLDALARIFFRYPLEIFDESLLPAGHRWVVLDVHVADIFLDGFCGLTLNDPGCKMAGLGIDVCWLLHLVALD
nr:hypothetical protein [Nostoc sp. NZL]